MKLTIKYFGMIAEALNKSEEIISFNNSITVSEIKNLLLEKNNSLTSLDFKIALNHNLVNHDVLISTDAEIALLPPFAGG